MLSTKKKSKIQEKQKEQHATTEKKVRNQDFDHAIDQERKEVLSLFFFYRFPPQYKLKVNTAKSYKN